MKKFILIFTLTLFQFHINYYSQITKIDKAEKVEIGKIAPAGKLHFSIEKRDSIYIFTYSDVKYSYNDVYKTFSFKDIDNAFENLYEIIMKGLENPPKKNIVLKLPNDIIELKFIKSLGVSNVKFIHIDKYGNVGHSIWLTKKKVAKLFGKSYYKKKK